ncbi:MAG: hypothetical protein V4605_03345 [Pseudomonadota bacterium]
MTTEIAEYKPTESALADLAKRYEKVQFDVTTKEGMRSAIEGRAEIRKLRIDLEKKRVEIKAPALAKCTLIDSEARRITAVLVSLEEPIDDQIKFEERKKQEELESKIRAEKERIEAEEKAKRDAQEAELQKQRDEIIAQQAAMRKAEEERLEAERQSRLKIEEEERAARFAREEADRKARAEIEAAEVAARQARQAEDDRLQAEREKIIAANRELEEKQRKEREADAARARIIQQQKDAAEREKQIAAQQKLDGMNLLNHFVLIYGEQPDFKEIGDVIHKWISKKFQAKADK